MEEIILTGAMALVLLFIFNKLIPLKKTEVSYSEHEKKALPL